jgi:peptide/nickel transport system permease protein
MTYLGYAIRRLILLIPTVIGLTIVIFLLTRAIPGDPARLALGTGASQQAIENLNHIWGLDQPLYIQYFQFINGILHGSLGISLSSREDVVIDLQSRFPPTIELATLSVIISLAVGLPLGVISASHKDQWQDHTSRLIGLGGVALPDFWTGIMLLVLFGAILRIFPIGGQLDLNLTPPHPITGFLIIDSFLEGNWTDFFNALQHISIPAFVLSLPGIANISRLTRSAMIDQKGKDYVLMEKASGLPPSLITYKYMLKSAFSPVLTQIALQYAFAFSGAVVVEYVFVWPGIGQYLAFAILDKDINAITGVVLVLGVVIAVTNFLIELALGWLDPRVRLRQGG